MKTEKVKIGFTLVEILIVVVIMGILAAIVIPQFSAASSQARESYLMTSLQNLRSQVELYRIHHNDLLPGEVGDENGNVTVKTTSERFFAALSSRTNENGQIGQSEQHRFGPYLREIPANPFSGTNADIVEVDGTAGNDTHGWHLTTFGLNRGLLQADDSQKNGYTDEMHCNY